MRAGHLMRAAAGTEQSRPSRTGKPLGGRGRHAGRRSRSRPGQQSQSSTSSGHPRRQSRRWRGCDSLPRCRPLMKRMRLTHQMGRPSWGSVGRPGSRVKVGAWKVSPPSAPARETSAEGF